MTVHICAVTKNLSLLIHSGHRSLWSLHDDEAMTVCVISILVRSGVKSRVRAIVSRVNTSLMFRYFMHVIKSRMHRGACAWLTWMLCCSSSIFSASEASYPFTECPSQVGEVVKEFSVEMAPVLLKAATGGAASDFLRVEAFHLWGGMLQR